jgi:4-carboxymuconolactone decarboxylase
VTRAAAPRLAPVPTERWGEDAQAALRGTFPKEVVDRFVSTGPDAVRVPNVLATLMHHPALAGPFLAYNRFLLDKPALGHRLRELMILRVAWRTRSNYEWLQHVRHAQRLAVTSEEIEAIASGAPSPSFTPLEVDLIAAADQLLDRQRIDDATWTRLAEQLDERQLIEAVFVVGTYTCLAMAFKSFGLELDPDLRSIAAPLPEPEE